MPKSDTAVVSHDPIVWREAGFDPEAYRGVHALAPISLGLAIPALVLLYAFPEMVAYWALMICLYLLVIFLLTAVIFIRSIMRAESVAQVTADPSARTVSVTRQGSFGNTVDFIPFDKVSGAYLHVRYDDDGYIVNEPRLRLKSGEEIVLPGEVSPSELNSLKRMLGAR